MPLTTIRQRVSSRASQLNLGGLLLCLLLQIPIISQAQTPVSLHVPEPLKPWIPWIMARHQNHTCPLIQQTTERRCTWPSRLELTLTEHGGRFEQQWTVYAESAIRLPGSSTQWPTDVRSQSGSLPVLENNGQPIVRLAPGTHTITGSFLWTQLPEQLLVPPDTGLLRLTINHEQVPIPALDPSGRLWIQHQAAQNPSAAHNSLTIRVARFLSDQIPFTVITQLDLDVSGDAREALLGQALLPDFIPLSLTSPLPTKLEPNGRLRTQLRAGHWTIQLIARAPGPITDVALPNQGTPWSEQGEEYWSVEARPELRSIELTGLDPIDPKTAPLPNGWGKHPTYRITPGQQLHFSETRRGESGDQQDLLTLQRQAWLDFTGEALTIQDHLAGTVSHTWRFTALPDTHLGQVTLNGTPQFITQTEPDKPYGVEIRHGKVDILAESRIEISPDNIAASGWDLPVHNLTTRLNLPPGWSVFHAAGPDVTTHTWISRWTLFDFFLVLILIVATAHLYSGATAALMATMLLLTYHQPDAPHFLWAHLLIATALIKGFPQGRFHMLATTYRLVVWFLIAFTAGPFAVQTIRTGLYPQLLYPGHMMATPAAASPGTDHTPSKVAEARRDQSTLTTQNGDPASAREEEIQRAFKVIAEASRDQSTLTAQNGDSATAAKQELQPSLAESPYQLDASRSLALYPRASQPRARIQTGPGLPTWHYNTASFSWSGPVQPDERLRLWLISPTLQLWLNLGSVLTMALLLGRVFAGISLPPRSWPEWFTRTSVTATIALSLLLASTGQSWATPFPPDTLLNELETRLTSPPPCHPQCGTITNAHLTVREHSLQIRLESHSAIETTIPLPGRNDQWTVTRVTIGAKTPPLARSSDGTLWVTVPTGIHHVLLEGYFPQHTTAQLTFPLIPRRVTTDAPHWTIEGLHQDHTIDPTLQFVSTRTPRQSSALSQHSQTTLPPFLLIDRTLTFDLTWHMTTSVTRVSPIGSSIVEPIPLLAGESVTSPQITTKAHQALVQLKPDQQSIQWESTLQIATPLTLTAGSQTNYVETWHFHISPIWHPSFTGIPNIHHRTTTGDLEPTYKPWPGETLRLELLKPSGAAGSTLTIDQSHLSVNPGTRSTDTTLTLTLRSSQGGQHSLILPEHSTLNSASIDGQSLPMQLDHQTLRLPIQPGAHTVHLAWQIPTGIETTYTGPSVNLGIPSVNHHITLDIPHNRWPLAISGPGVGPAVLFWGILLLLVLLALGLSLIPASPLSFTEWLLLSMGLSQVPIAIALPVILWLLAMRGRNGAEPALMSARRFNAMQIGLALLTVIALGCLAGAVKQGLLGNPSMSIDGNGSTATLLQWYVDRTPAELPVPTLISVSIYWFRGLMLLWSLWLAFALIRWMNWSYTAFTAGGYWKGRTALTQDGQRTT